MEVQKRKQATGRGQKTHFSRNSSGSSSLWWLLAANLVCFASSVEAQVEASNAEAEAGAEAPSVPVRVETVSTAPFAQFGEYLGTVEAVSDVQLIAYGGGRVDQVKVRAGEQVKKGNALCAIEGERFDVMAEAAKLREKIARQKRDRLKKHVAKGSSSRLQLDQANLELLEAKRARIDAQKTRDGAYCVSPISGVVTARSIEPFAELPAGAPTLAIASLGQLKVRFGVSDAEISGMSIGLPGEVMLPFQSVAANDTETSTAPKSWRGQVRAVDQKVNEADRNVQVELALDDPGQELRPGMTVRVRILRNEVVGKVVIPRAAVRRSSGKRSVMVKVGALAREQSIQVLAENERFALVGRGLKPGDQLIVSGQALLSDATPVKVVP